MKKIIILVIIIILFFIFYPKRYSTEIFSHDGSYSSCLGININKSVCYGLIIRAHYPYNNFLK